VVSKDNSAYSLARLAVHQMVPPPNAEKGVLADFYHRRAMTARAAGLYPQWISESDFAASLVPGSLQEYFYTVEAAYAKKYSASPERALIAQRRLQTIGTRLKSAPILGNAHGLLAMTYLDLGDLREARRNASASASYYTSARGGDPGAPMWKNAWDAESRLYQAALLSSEGKLLAAEDEARASIAAQLRHIESFKKLVERGKPLPVPMSWLTNQLASIRIELADILGRQGRYAEAEIELRAALVPLLETEGSRSPTVAELLTRFSRMLICQGRYTEAEQIGRAAVSIFEKSQADPTAAPFVEARRAVGSALVGQERFSDAREQYDQIEDLAPNGLVRGKFFVGDIDWATSLMATGQLDRAKRLLEVLVPFLNAQVGYAHYDSAEARALLGATLAQKGDRSGVGEMQQAFKVLRATGAGLEVTPMRARRMGEMVERYLAQLSRQRSSSALAQLKIDPVEESFQVAELTRSGNVPRTVAAAAARNRARDPQLGELARAEQDSHWQISQLESALLAHAALPPEQKSVETLREIKEQLAQHQAARSAIQEQIGRRFPAYESLVRVQPVTVDQVRKDLADGEALIAVFVGRLESFAWTIPKAGEPVFQSIALDAATVQSSVAALRESLDLNVDSLAQVPKFDVQQAHDLYQRLLAPTNASWRGARHLIVVPHRELAQLPFALLPTAAPVQPQKGKLLFEHYRGVQWLARDYAISYAPSVGAFSALRSVQRGADERKIFAGVGDPYFSLEQYREANTEAPAVRGAFATRDLRIMRVEPAGDVPAHSVRNSSRLAQVPRLPDTADEIRQIARALNADLERDVFLGVEADERLVKAGALEQRKVVAFATHGLVAGELDGLTQPALALSAPEVTGHSDEDGLLTMEEILGLKLDADWVVLSACNTASGDGAGAEAVSGLGRAFFFAGARSLLVTHWAVETTSAKRLTVELFKRQADPSLRLSKAEALRLTMLDLIDNGVYVDEASGRAVFTYAHPAFWAPFALVGDG